MKIVATIADDRTPKGWQESFLTSVTNIESAKGWLDGLISTFNASLRPNEEPRRLLNVELIPLTEDEGITMGAEGYHDGDDINPFQSGTDEHRWFNQGYDEAHEADSGDTEEEQVSPAYKQAAGLFSLPLMSDAELAGREGE